MTLNFGLMMLGHCSACLPRVLELVNGEVAADFYILLVSPGR